MFYETQGFGDEAQTLIISSEMRVECCDLSMKLSHINMINWGHLVRPRSRWVDDIQKVAWKKEICMGVGALNIKEYYNDYFRIVEGD